MKDVIAMIKGLSIYTVLFLMGLFSLQSCGSDDTSGGNVIEPEPELIGCEAAESYDWDSIEFETSLNGGADIWLAFSIEEITYFKVYVSQAGFYVSIFAGCDGEFGAGDTLFEVETIGNGIDIGIVESGDYWVNILNTRPNRMDFTFRLELSEIILGCMNNDALNYNDTANVDDGSCEFNDCNTDYYLENYGEMVLDCDGNCAPSDWIGDGYCDDGVWAIYDEEGNQVPINLMCDEFNWDEGDCEAQPEGCTPGLVEDCNGICGPESWIGDGYCDDGAYTYNGYPIYFNCEEFNNDEGDCDGLGRTTQTRPYPNGRILIGE